MTAAEEAGIDDGIMRNAYASRRKHHTLLQSSAPEHASERQTIIERVSSDQQTLLRLRISFFIEFSANAKIGMIL